MHEESSTPSKIALLLQLDSKIINIQQVHLMHFMLHDVIGLILRYFLQKTLFP